MENEAKQKLRERESAVRERIRALIANPEELARMRETVPNPDHVHGWIITKVYEDVGLEQDEVGIRGPRGMTASIEQILAHGADFQMRDDDNTPYYEGKLIAGDRSEFAPLDDFGKGNAGCTMLLFKEEGSTEWELL